MATDEKRFRNKYFSRYLSFALDNPKLITVWIKITIFFRRRISIIL